MDRDHVAKAVADFFAGLEQVRAVALSGSTTAGRSDGDSDIDLYVYLTGELAPEIRRDWIASRASRFEIDNRFWEPGDEWIEKQTGLCVDVMYREPRWIEDRIDSVLVRHEASLGYTTCFWTNILSSRILFDRAGWLKALKDRANIPYPKALREAIIRKNHRVLTENISSYRNQIRKAIARIDPVSLHHRTTAFLASYFDILFALNDTPHPGEKRLLQSALALQRVPANLESLVLELLSGVTHPETALSAASRLLEALDPLLASD